MSKKTSYLLGILLTIIRGTFLFWKFCCNCCDRGASCCKEASSENTIVENVDVKEATRLGFALTDGDMSINVNDHFNFNGSDYSIIEPVFEELKNSLGELKVYLEDNPFKHINITGYYTANEKNPSAYPNLGLARANAVKNYLRSIGISSKVIDTFGELKDDLVPDTNNIYYGPVKYAINSLQEGDTSYMDAITAKCDAIKANPLVLYFNTGEAQINLTAEQRQKIADITSCVDHTGAKVLVVGHTDNTGDAANNVILGQQRADFAKGYLVRNGIGGDDIEATSKGQTEPIADNATEEGKAKNRRTVITIN